MATAKELAVDKNVAVNGGQMARQCLEAGLLDEVGARPVQLEGPSRWSRHRRHALRYRVKK